MSNHYKPHESVSSEESPSVVPLEESPLLPSKETPSENLKDQANLEKTSPWEPDSNAPLKGN